MIEWKQSEKDGMVYYGLVNGVRLYTVQRTLNHAALRSGFPVALGHTLPFARIRKNWRNVEQAKEYAEHHLTAAMLHLGFVRKD